MIKNFGSDYFEIFIDSVESNSTSSHLLCREEFISTNSVFSCKYTSPFRSVSVLLLAEKNLYPLIASFPVSIHLLLNLLPCFPYEILL